MGSAIQHGFGWTNKRNVFHVVVPSDPFELLLFVLKIRVTTCQIWRNYPVPELVFNKLGKLLDYSRIGPQLSLRMSVEERSNGVHGTIGILGVVVVW